MLIKYLTNILIHKVFKLFTIELNNVYHYNLLMDHNSINVIVVDKTKKITMKKIKNIQISDIHKITKNTKSTWIHAWKCDDNYLHIYGSIHGNAGKENLFELPPPVDNVLCFDSLLCILSKSKTKPESSVEHVVNIHVRKFNMIMDTLFGGYESLNSDDSIISSEDDEYYEYEHTKEGYAKDGFVVE